MKKNRGKSEKNLKEIVEFAGQLVKTPSQNGIDSEEKIAGLVFKKLSEFGFFPKIIGDKKHPSVFCEINKNPNGKTIWLESCLDTVPTGDLSKWKYPLLKTTVKNNKMHGRGVADSKIAIAIFCFLAKELCDDIKFKGNLILGFDADEQSGEFTGIKNILKQKPKADVCILGYQGVDKISIGARGWLRLKITAKGKSAHTGARYNKGINAIHQMGDIISALKKINLNAKKEPLFNFGSNLNISLIQGGAAINIIPDKCEAKIDIRFLLSQTKKQILDKIYKQLKILKQKDSNLNYKIDILQCESAYLTNPENKFVKLFQKNSRKKLKRKIPLTGSGAGSVGNIISKKNIPIVNSFGCNCGNIHAPNEWINLKTILPIFEIYKKTILEFCGYFPQKNNESA